MKKFFRNDFVESICIGLSLILLWAPAAFVIADMNTEKFLTSYLYRTWMNFFGLLISLFIFHAFFDFIPKRKQRAGWVLGTIAVVIVMLSAGYINWLKLGMRLNTYPKEEAAMINMSYWLRAAIYQFYGIFYFVAIKLLLRYLKLKNNNQQLALEKKTSELSFLKSHSAKPALVASRYEPTRLISLRVRFFRFLAGRGLSSGGCGTILSGTSPPERTSRRLLIPWATGCKGATNSCPRRAAHDYQTAKDRPARESSIAVGS